MFSQISGSISSRSAQRTIRFSFFFFNDTATTEIYTLSLHDALPISAGHQASDPDQRGRRGEHDVLTRRVEGDRRDRKSTRLNSSHLVISYAVFCLKKKKNDHASHAMSCYGSRINQTPNLDRIANEEI